MFISFYFILWLIVIIIAGSLIVFPLWIINVWFHYKALKLGKAPKPFVITIKQLGIVRLLLLPLLLLPISPSKLNKLKGRWIWLSWDIRWLSADSTLARIEEVLKRPKGYAFLIRLERPMKLSSGSIIIEKIVFEPNSSLTNLIRYYLGAVCGGLHPSEHIEGIKNLINNGRLATCEIVVY